MVTSQHKLKTCFPQSIPYPLLLKCSSTLSSNQFLGESLAFVIDCELFKLFYLFGVCIHFPCLAIIPGFNSFLIKILVLSTAQYTKLLYSIDESCVIESTKTLVLNLNIKFIIKLPIQTSFIKIFMY